MAARWIYRLQPRRGFHFGARGIGLEASAESGASDTLFGALCQGIRATQGLDDPARGLLAMLDAFQSPDPPFLLSSLFPYAGDVLLLPRPLPLFSGAGKRARKVRYLSWALFAQYAGAADDAARAAAFRPQNVLSTNHVWVTAAEREALALFVDPDEPDGPPRLWQEGDSPRVTVDRRTNESAVYQAGWVAFPDGAGLYFLVEWRDPAWQPAVHAALEYLAEEGIGGERSAGYGQFQFAGGAAGTPGAPAPDLPAYGGADAAQMTLSLYHPTAAEAARLGEGWYDLVMRRGWVGAPGALGARRRDVLMVQEGSVLPPGGAGPFGEMVDVTPDAWPPKASPPDGRLLRYGYALPLPIPPQKGAADAPR